MGAYINPPDQTKEEWLEENAVRGMASEFKWVNTPPDYLPIVYIHNGMFTTAAICFSEAEFQVFTDPNDSRPKMYFYALEDALHLVSPDLKRYQR